MALSFQKSPTILLLSILFFLGLAFSPFFPSKIVQASQTLTTIRVTVTGCGNNTKDTGEDCDGTDFGGATCVSRGYTSGNLSCNADCTFNVSGCASAPVTQPPGGGGGGGGPTIPTQVVMQGLAYPGAKLTILKDGKVTASGLLADSGGNFNVSLTTLTAGIYTFGIWAEDSKGRKSIAFSFTVTVQSGVITTISNIFLPPTIELDRVGVQRGETLNILGETVPESEITIKIESSQPITATTTADKLGGWDYSLNTNPLEDGTHLARAKANLNGILSSYSNVLAFYVGKEVAPGKTKTADIGGDNKVNLIDFSILLYNWGLPKNTKADLNDDGQVNLTDFSIMMYQWTG